MKFSIRFSDQIVGALVILALAMLIFVVFMLGRSQRWFEKDPEYITHFSSAQGMSENMALHYKGFTIGRVKKISLEMIENTNDDVVVILFYIFNEYADMVKKGSLVEVQISPIGLGNSFIFHPGTDNELLEIDKTTNVGFIPEVNSEEGKRIITEKKSSRPEGSSDDISAILHQVRLLTETLNGAENTEELPFGQILASLNKLVKDFTSISDALATSIKPFIEEAAADPPKVIVALLQDLLVEEGPFGGLYSNLEDGVESIVGILDSADRTIDILPEIAPSLLSIIKKLDNALYDIHDMIIALNNNPLLRGGIPERMEYGHGGSSSRDIQF